MLKDVWKKRAAEIEAVDRHIYFVENDDSKRRLCTCNLYTHSGALIQDFKACVAISFYEHPMVGNCNACDALFLEADKKAPKVFKQIIRKVQEL